MNFFKSVFFASANETAPTTPHEKPRSEFSIEHYPLSGKYFVRVGKQYIRRNTFNELLELVDTIDRVHFCAYIKYGEPKSEADCDRIIQEYKEQQYKENVRIIPR